MTDDKRPIEKDLLKPYKLTRLEQRREKIRAELDRNAQGDHKVPTWVLVAILVALVGGIAALMIFTE
jgi:hypothetical protein